MELKVQGRLLTAGIIDAVLARIDGDVTKSSIIGREAELMRQLGENVAMPLRLLEGLIKPVKEVNVAIVPIEDDALLVDSLLAVKVKIIFEDGDTYETREATLGVASFDLREIYSELFLPQLKSEGGRYTVVYPAHRNAIDPFDILPYVEFEAADGWNGGGVNRLQGELDTLRFAECWHVQHYKGEYWYAFLLMDVDIVTKGDVFGGERIYAPFAIDIPWRLLSDAVKQDIKTMEKIFENQL